MHKTGQRRDTKVRHKLDMAYLGGVAGPPVARSTVQIDAVVASKSCSKDLLEQKKASQTECRQGPEGPKTNKTVSLDADNVGNT